MDINIKYIRENFIESNDLCKVTGISQTELDKLIDLELIPNASYTINESYQISSPLGDEKIISDKKKYFSKSSIELVRGNKNLNQSFGYKEKIKSEFTESFLSNEGNSFGYGNLINEHGNIDLKKLDIAFEEEWKYYLQGVYGICTLNGTGSEIAKKEIAVKKLIAFNEKNDGIELSENQKKELINLNDEFNKIANTFAPYQRENSSRGKYLDKILEFNGLVELKAKYD